MEDEKKSGDWALNTLKDIWKYDKARLLDLGNDFQVLLSQNKPDINEEARATSNFEKLTEGKKRPLKHTLVDATRILPDIAIPLVGAVAGAGLGALGIGFKKAFSERGLKKTGSDVAKKLVRENTNDAAQGLSKSLLKNGGDKDVAAKKWLNNLWENKEAMNRIANKQLSDKELQAVRKALPKEAKSVLQVQNVKIDNMKKLLNSNSELAGLTSKEQWDKITKARNIIDQAVIKGNGDVVAKKGTSPKDFNMAKRLTKENFRAAGHPYRPFQLGQNELVDNLKEIADVGKNANFSRFNVEKAIKGLPVEKQNQLRNALLTSAGIGAGVASGVLLDDKALDAGINDSLKTKFTTDHALEMKPDYWTRGSKPTPMSDFFAGMFNVDFNDPARFNEKDINRFFDFLESNGFVEPGIGNEWTPRQKVSVMREILSDDTMGPMAKAKWAEYKKKGE